jgi:hypothetical protein
MNTPKRLKLIAAIAATALASPTVLAFDSGSTGADGDLNPTANVAVPLPPSGVLQYRSINIPPGVTVTFQRNATNTPVVLLVQENVTLAGTIDISGADAPPAGSSGSIADDGKPGLAGPGGFDGGRGGGIGRVRGSAGLGPGGGSPGYVAQCTSGAYLAGATHGAFSSATGTLGFTLSASGCDQAYNPVPGAQPYGSTELLPLVGGSGGGGGAGWLNFSGAGGGGGGGAILIAASGTVNVANTGVIRANGGRGGDVGGYGAGSPGGAGSGGAIRIIATAITGAGQLLATGGQGGTITATTGAFSWSFGGAGSPGRIRLEAQTYTRTGVNNPSTTPLTSVGAIYVPNTPTLRIAKVAGQTVPSQPTGNRDVLLAADTPNPVTVEFETSGIPPGNTVLLTVAPPSGEAFNRRSPALVGDSNSATASVSVDLPAGNSTLSATVTYQIVLALGDSLSRYAMGERVDSIRVSTTLGGDSGITLITVSGKEFALPRAAWIALGAS